MGDELFTTRMRKATKKIHSLSDTLVRAKLVILLRDREVWAGGLLMFYDIFKFLENAMLKRKGENLGKLHMPELVRTQAFEKDLTYYLGRNWKQSYKMTENVQKYISHLRKLLETDSDLLMAYVYHLYMGLLSGGQIIKMKRQLTFDTLLETDAGEAALAFTTQDIPELKKQLKDKMNSIAEGLSEKKKQQLIEESVKVFELNNKIIDDVQAIEKGAFKTAFIYSTLTFVIITILVFYFYTPPEGL